MSTEFEHNRQKMNLKELNGMDTLNEQVKEIEIVLGEFFNTTSQEEVISILEESQRESEILDRIVGESRSFPLAAIEKLLPFIELMAEKVLGNPSEKAISSLLNHACDDLASYSRKLVYEGMPIPSDHINEITEDDIAILETDELRKKWNDCFSSTLIQIRDDIINKDNTKLCDHCNNLWGLSNIADIFFD